MLQVMDKLRKEGKMEPNQTLHFYNSLKVSKRNNNYILNGIDKFFKNKEYKNNIHYILISLYFLYNMYILSFFKISFITKNF